MILCAWLTPVFFSHDGGLAGSSGLRANSSQYHLYYFGSFTSSFAVLTLKEDTEDPSLKALWSTHLSFRMSAIKNLGHQEETVQIVLS